MLNQAGLGWTTKNSVSIHHIRPFNTGDLGISTLAATFPTGSGSIGSSFSSIGIEGFRQTSSWIAYGMKVCEGITAGLGVHFWYTSIPGRLLHHPGFGFAIGIQARINNRFILGGHVLHPVGWSAPHSGLQPLSMVVSAGCSYTFFNNTTYGADLLVYPRGGVQVSHVVDAPLLDRGSLLLGMHNRPYAVMVGINLKYSHWDILISLEYLIETGVNPSSSLTYAW
jgi:hypothetical protein